MPTRSAPARVVAVDLGATSGRVTVAEVDAVGRRLDLREVHRFPNAAVRAADGSLRWDLDMLHREVVEGIRLAGPVDSVGIDSWGVDYGLLDRDGRLLGPPYSHRDARTEGIAARVVAEVGDASLYDVTGIQQLPFNTLYQLVADREAERLDGAETLLLVPDLLGYLLTGSVGAERTNASTTQLLDATTGKWATGLLARLDIPTGLLPPIREPGQVVGTMADGVPVVAVGSHDTASAVVGVPAGEGPFAYLSSGTWSLVGLELPAPVLTPEARTANFTNELGIDGTVRFLRNVMGLWVLSECVREWRTDLDVLLAEAGRLPSAGVVDVDDPRLLPPGDMPARVVRLAEEAGLDLVPEPGALTRLVLDSLADAYRRTVEDAARVSGVRPEVVHVVGGGSQNALLCQLTADACGVPVVAGPTEAAAVGNALVQARTLGQPLPDLASMRALVRDTQSLTRYEPRR